MARWKVQPWRLKIEEMIKKYKTELSELAPWMDMLISIPLALSEKLSWEQALKFDEIIMRLNAVPHLRDIPAECESALAFFETLDGNDNAETAVWLKKTKDALAQSRSTAESLICRYKDLIVRIRALSEATRFLPLYDAKKQLFSIGYSIKEKEAVPFLL